MDIKNTETVTIKTNAYSGRVWNQTLTNRLTGEQLTIGIMRHREDEESEWNFDVLRDLITKHISQYLPVDPNAKERFGICKVNYQGFQMQCEFTFEPFSYDPLAGWYVNDAWVLSANVLGY